MKPLYNFFCCVLILCAVATAQDPIPGPLPADLATIHFYRANQFTAKLKSPVVYCKEHPLAKMQNGRYFSIKVPAGLYAIRSEDRGVGIQLQAEAGKEYFVRVEMAAGAFKGTQQVTQVSPELGSTEIHLLKPIDSKNVIDRDQVRLN